MVTYTGTVNSQVGAGSALTNVASVEFNSRSDGTGRQVPLSTDVSQHNTDDSTADIPPATIAKSQNTAGDLSAIGQPYTYSVDVTVPAHTTVYNSAVTDTIVDGLAVDGTSTYVTAPAGLGTVAVAAPAATTVTVTWDIGDYTNNTGSAQVITLQINVHIKTTYVTADRPGARAGGDTFANTADLDWDDADDGRGPPHRYGYGRHRDRHRTRPDPDQDQRRRGPIPGGQTVHYTLTAVNNGTSASYQNVLTDTLPVGMRNIPPTVTNVTLAGVPLIDERRLLGDLERGYR